LLQKEVHEVLRAGKQYLDIARGLLIALMMEAASNSETSVNFYQTTRRNNPEDSHLQYLDIVRKSKFLLECFLPTFLKKESEAYEITSLSVCLCGPPPPINFEPFGRFL
jgi:hypothetical protein